jgi:head-tail adaptor
MPISTFLNGRAPTQLRGLQWLALSDTGNILTQVSTSDSGGGATQSWTAGTAVQCRIDPVGDRGDSRIVGGRIDERSTHVVTVPAGTPVLAAGRFSIAGRGTFEITVVRERTAEFTQVFEVIEIS